MTTEERNLIALIEAEDFNGLAQLIELFGTDILRTIQAILNHSNERPYIKEIQNKVFYRLWEELGHYDESKSSLRTWIMVITRNLAIDEKRKIIRYSHIVPVEDLSWASDGQVDNYLEKEQFLDLLDTLTIDDQLIFLKFYFYQESAQEIGAELALSPEVIFNRLSRGRRKLAQTLSPERSN